VGGVPNGFGQSHGPLRDLDQLTQEIRLASNGEGKLKWQVGGLYFDARDYTDFYQRGVFVKTNPNNWVVLKNENTSWAVFGQASYEVTDKLTITGGVRQTDDTKKTRLLKHRRHRRRRRHLYRSPLCEAVGQQAQLGSERPTIRVNDDVSVYARVAKGFRGPTIQGRSAVFNADFTTADSETILSYEAGFKSTLLDNTLRLNASAFTYEVKRHPAERQRQQRQRRAVQRRQGQGLRHGSRRRMAPGRQPDPDGRRQPAAQRDQGQARLRPGLRPERRGGLHGGKPDDQDRHERLRPDRRPAAAERPEVQRQLHGPLRRAGGRRAASCSSPPTGTCRATPTSCSTRPRSSTRRTTSKAA
jgi:hypothetical protein